MDATLLRVDEAARLLGLSRTTVYQLVAAGRLPTIRIGRSVRIPREALADWIGRNMTSAVTAGEPAPTEPRRITAGASIA